MPRLVELDKKYRGQQVEFLAIDSNQQDSLAEIAHFAESHKIVFPVKKDPGNKVADLFGATRTPEAYVLDREGVIRYAGLIDDQFGIGYAHDKPKRRFVDDRAGRPAGRARGPRAGDRIDWLPHRSDQPPPADGQRDVYQADLADPRGQLRDVPSRGKSRRSR